MKFKDRYLRRRLRIRRLKHKLYNIIGFVKKFRKPLRGFKDVEIVGFNVK